MKYYEKRKHLITKTVLCLILGAALFFALCDCTPKSQREQIVLTYTKE